MIKTIEERFWAKVAKKGTDECWEWQGACIPRGYGQFGFAGKICKSHRISYAWHHPMTINLLDEPDICVCHKCDNPKCVNPTHLFLGSNADNVRDRVEKGRGNPPKGENHAHSKLTEVQVLEIRSRYDKKNKILHQTLAAEYGVSSTTIGRIIRRQRWKAPTV